MEKQSARVRIVCTSVFESGEPSSIKKGLTEKWIELIDRAEKNKETMVLSEP